MSQSTDFINGYMEGYNSFMGSRYENNGNETSKTSEFMAGYEKGQKEANHDYHYIGSQTKSESNLSKRN